MLHTNRGSLNEMLESLRVCWRKAQFIDINENWCVSPELTPCLVCLNSSHAHFEIEESDSTDRNLGNYVIVFNSQAKFKIAGIQDQEVPALIVQFELKHFSELNSKFSLPSIIPATEVYAKELRTEVVDTSSLVDESQMSEAITNLLLKLVIVDSIRTEIVLRLTGSDIVRVQYDSDIEQAIKLMQNALSFPWTVESLAEHIHVSRSYFAKKFRDQTGVGPIQYLLNIRMQTANELLRKDRFQIYEIAKLTGYSSASAFTNAYRRWSGMTPKVYQDQNAIDR
ncbi:AraC family transcriptional regulator [Thalassoglobus polymorphus]|uniref:Putative response regulatory protein n=1 Tax=Thalassoglobus polymorphus TaxID=2527994 RepID=A0A517QIL7_9PLAN|nr:AraC family transcriptional regulator [Thalassoglobus polymorphus]QDT31481.1 putative response regulatory protein [Thalassoglobus polymorphus]